MFKTIIISFLIIFTFNSCTKIILSVGGSLVKVEDKVYSDLSEHRAKTHLLKKEILNVFNSKEKRKDASFKTIQTLYQTVSNNHNSLVDKIAKAICNEDSIIRSNYEKEFSIVSDNIDSLNTYFSTYGDGFASGDLEKIIIKAASDILKTLAKKTALKVYVNSFKKEHYIEDLVIINNS